jgi:phenylacetate-coenzyme A ligase PaaK-like adenylate-forming protein
MKLPDRAVGPASRLHRLTRPRFWRDVRRWRAFLRESQHWSGERLAEWQLERLRDLAAHAYATVPYYTELFDSIGMRPGDLRDLRALARIPTLAKQDLQERGDDLLSRAHPEHTRLYATTGGSTGMPVGFWFDNPGSVVAERAFMSALWSRVGYREGDRTAVLRGEVVAGGRHWELRPRDAQLRVSSYHLTDELIPRLLDRIRRFRPRFIQGYPSSLTLVARHMAERGEPPVDGVEALLCGSENLYDWQRELLEQAFECRAYSWYGLSERVALAGECERDRALHVFPQYGIVELVDARGAPIEDAGTVGEIAGTGLTNRGMPLIRYRTQDAAVWADGPCPRCGRPYRRLERIEGRLQEFIVAASGRPVSMTAINMHSPVFDNVRQFRFVQETPGRVVLRVVPKPSFGPADDERIRRELAPKLGPDIELAAIEPVDEIPPTRSGKQRFLDQRLSVNLGDS